MNNQLLTAIRRIVREEIKKGKQTYVNPNRVMMHSLPNFGIYAKHAKTK